MAGKGLPSIIKACLYGRRHGQLLSLAYQQGALCDVALTSHFENLKAFLYGWLPLSDAAGIIILQFGIPILFHSTMSFLCWALQMPVLDTPGFQIRVNEILSNNIRILTPN